MKTVPVSRLHEVFRLSEDGRLYWRHSGTGRRSPVAGCAGNYGYWVVTVDYVRLQAHRVVFAMAHGRWPVGLIDHINGIRTDNRPSNLREANAAENARNSVSSRNKSGVKGVIWNAKRQKWQAQIKVNCSTVNLGRFDDIELAELVVTEARRKYHGEFASHS